VCGSEMRNCFAQLAAGMCRAAIQQAAAPAHLGPEKSAEHSAVPASPCLSMGAPLALTAQQSRRHQLAMSLFLLLSAVRRRCWVTPVPLPVLAMVGAASGCGSNEALHATHCDAQSRMPSPPPALPLLPPLPLTASPDLSGLLLHKSPRSSQTRG
jgi:hypothetical protein